MAFGLQVWNESGVRILDSSSGITRILDIVEVGAGSVGPWGSRGGEIFNSLLVPPNRFYYNAYQSGNNGFQIGTPICWIPTPGRFYWNWEPGANSPSSPFTARIIYGFY